MSPAEALAMVGLTLRVGLIATLLALPPALALAYGLARHEFRGKSVVQALLALPMVMPPVVVGFALVLLFSRHGPLGGVLAALQVDVVFTWWAAVLAATIVGFPLLTRACEQAFAEVDPRLEQVARTLGCGRLGTFRRVTLPLARRGIAYGAILAFSRALGEFGATYVFAGIIPGETETLALGIYSRVQLGDDTGALWLCAASFALALGAMLVAEAWLRQERR